MAVGRVNVDAMLAEIDSSLLTEWMAFYRLEPWGFEAEMVGHGIVASRIDNLFKSNDETKSVPSDYIPELRFGEEADEDTTFIDDLRAYFRR